MRNSSFRYPEGIVVFCLHECLGIRHPECFGQSAEAVEPGVVVPGIVAAGAGFHGEAGIGHRLVIEFDKRPEPEEFHRGQDGGGACGVDLAEGISDNI